MTTHEPKHESKAMRRRRVRLEARLKQYQANTTGRLAQAFPAQAKAAHKPGSAK